MGQKAAVSLNRYIDHLFQEKATQESQTYRCILCSRLLDRSTQRRTIPDSRCSRCYRKWREENGQPWLRALENLNRAKKLKYGRWRKRGVAVETVSLERLPDQLAASSVRRF